MQNQTELYTVKLKISVKIQHFLSDQRIVQCYQQWPDKYVIKQSLHWRVCVRTDGVARLEQ